MGQTVTLQTFGGDGGLATVGAIQANCPAQLSDLNVQYGTFSIPANATGDQTDAITFSTPFANATDVVLLTPTSLGTTAAVLSGPVLATAVSKTGFTASVDVGTAGTGDITGYYLAFGH